ncbi:MAG: AraC family transcriptional regulator [Roseburia sp.]
MKYLEYQERRKQGTADFPIAFYHVELTHPRYQMPYHWHTECELIRVLKGSFPLTVGSQLYRMNAGDIVFIQDGMLHGGMPENCVYECIVFDMKLLLKERHICQKQIEAIMNHELLLNQLLPGHNSSIAQIAAALFSAMPEKYPGYEFTVLGTLYQLIGMILKENLYSLRSAHEQQISYRLKQLKQVLRYIEDHYAEDVSLDDLASIAGMNPKYFCRFFRQITLRTPIDYLNYYRIECAREQLAATDASITEVALGCGFNDISYFTKTFKKYMGLTPRQYMKQTY